jgi:carboxypeptidase Taq
VKKKLEELKTCLREVHDLESAASVLYWDQAAYMPSGGAEARARQIATLSTLAHEKFTAPSIGGLLDQLASYEQSLPYDSPDAGIVRITRQDYEKALKLPLGFVQELTCHHAQTYQVWTMARPANDFAAVKPYLQKTLELSWKYADFYSGYEHIADPLIDVNDKGMKASILRSLFGRLRKAIVPLAQSIADKPASDDSCLTRIYPEPEQLSFIIYLIKTLGYDFKRGRLDKTPHPFSTSFSINDVRITTRVNERYLNIALFSTIHEAGHAMYEQNICHKFEGTPLAHGVSMGVHESQSRLWENIVGRSYGFWKFFYPKIKKTFPEQLKSVSLEDFYRAINKVMPSLIRTDADEVTYNLHVIMRFDIECALLEGRLTVHDLPEIWRERFKEDFGIMPPNDKDGVLQDIHWYYGNIGGAFQGYTIGNLLGAQLFDAACREYPEITEEISHGKFDALRKWLNENIHQYGRMYAPDEIVEKATGKPLSVEPFINYLINKFGHLYNI